MPTPHTKTSPPLLPAHQTDVPSGGRGASAAGTPSSMGYGDSLEAFRKRIFSITGSHWHKALALSALELPIHPSSSIIPLWLYNPKPPHHHTSPKPRRQRTVTRCVALRRAKPSRRYPRTPQNHTAVHVPYPRTHLKRTNYCTIIMQPSPSF
jgi:hypothetical protein